MEPKISIVIPIYNMELYLSRCLDSLLAQSFADMEIIAVNDGSLDSTEAILERYAESDSRIVVINKSNGGVSSARNAGVQMAKGDYIGFVDPDDWVDPAMYEEMYVNATQADADIVMCTYIREFGTHAKEKVFQMPDMTIYRNEELQTTMTRRIVGPLREELANPEFLDAWGTVWSKLYRASLIKGNEIRFIDLSVVGSNEDSLFNMYAFYHADSFVFLNRPYYHYWRANSDSITSTYNPLLATKFEKLYAHIEAFLVDKNLEEQYHRALNNRICMNILGLGLNIVNKDNKSSLFMKIKSLKALVSNPRIQRSFRGFELQYSPIVWKIFFRCAKLRYATGIYFMLEAINWIRVKNMRGVQGEAGTNTASRNRDESRGIGNDAHELLPPDGSKQNSI